MNYIVKQILKQRRITEYLTKKGILPDGPEVNGKLKYRCPIHDKDNTPSFYVYLRSKEFENFYCFGCKARYHIIHLYRDLEKVSLGEAVRALAEGIDINVNSEINSVIDDINKDQSPQSKGPIYLSLQINKAMYYFLEQVNFDSDCIASVEKMGEVVDLAVDRGDSDALQKIDEHLSDTLAKRVRIYTEQQEKREQEILRAALDVKID